MAIDDTGMTRSDLGYPVSRWTWHSHLKSVDRDEQTAPRGRTRMSLFIDKRRPLVSETANRCARRHI